MTKSIELNFTVSENHVLTLQEVEAIKTSQFRIVSEQCFKACTLRTLCNADLTISLKSDKKGKSIDGKVIVNGEKVGDKGCNLIGTFKQNSNLAD